MGKKIILSGILVLFSPIIYANDACEQMIKEVDAIFDMAVENLPDLVKLKTMEEEKVNMRKWVESMKNTEQGEVQCKNALQQIPMMKESLMRTIAEKGKK